MKIFDASAGNLSTQHLQEIITVLNSGGVIIFPTETVYGLMCRYNDLKAKQRILDMKKRPANKELQCLISHPQEINNFDIKISNLAKKIIKNCFPGTLTIILTNKQGETFGFRQPNFPLLQKLLNTISYPLWATSANISGQKDDLPLNKIIDNLAQEADLAIKNDDFLSQASTVVKINNDNFEILRNGKITAEQLEKIKLSL